MRRPRLELPGVPVHLTHRGVKRAATLLDDDDCAAYLHDHQWATAAAFRMHKQMGRGRVAARIRSLNDQLKSGLAENAKVTLHTPRSGDLSAGLFAFEIAGIKPADVVKQLLARKIIASTRPYAVTYARLAPTLVNTPEQVERAVRAVRELSG